MTGIARDMVGPRAKHVVSERVGDRNLGNAGVLLGNGGDRGVGVGVAHQVLVVGAQRSPRRLPVRTTTDMLASPHKPGISR